MPRPLASWFLRQTPLLIPLLILLPVLWVLLPGGLPNSADGMVHFTRITETVSSWRDGILLPRWSLNLGFGYGVPVFIFGPPLSYWLGAAYNIVGFGPEAAYKSMLVTVLLIGAMGAYRLGQALLGLWAGAVAVVAFIYAPNLLFTLFVQGNAPQLLAWGFMPWALWATIQIFRAHRQRDQWLYGLALALAVSGTLISHNVVSLILIPTVAALAVVLWIGTRRQRALWVTAAGGALGGMMSAWFVVPALLETVYASTDAIVASDYRSRFVPLLELLAWPPRLDAGAINPYIPRTLGLPQVIIAVVGVILLVGWAFTRRALPIDSSGTGHSRKNLAQSHQAALSPRRGLSGAVRAEAERPFQGDRVPDGVWHRVLDGSHRVGGRADDDDGRVFWATAIFMTLYAGFCAWMATQASLQIWAMLPLLEFFQFPARWIGFAGFGLAWLAAAAVGLLGGLAAGRVQPLVAGAICLFLITPALVYLYPDKTLPGTRLMSPYEVVRYELRSGAIGTTSYGEFNPRWAPRPLPPSPMVEDYMARRPVDRLKGMLPPGASHQVLEVNAHRQRYEITLTAPATISINLLYFPGWRATVNQNAVEIWPQEGTGLITVELPAGTNALDLTFGPTPLRRAMGWLSSGAWLVLLVAFVVVQVRRIPAPSPQTIPNNQAGGVVVMTTVLIGVVLVLQIGGAEWFQLHSPPDQALVAPVQRYDDIGGRFRLLGQNPLPTTVRAGAMLPVVTYWRSLEEMDENYGALLRMEEVGSGQILVEAEQSHPSDIPTSGWATGLYVRNEWQLPIPADALPLQYALRIGFRDPATGEMLPTQGGTMVELGRLWVLPQAETKPADGPHARFGSAIELLGAAREGGVLTLYWRAKETVSGEYTIFVHLLNPNGELVGQMDGLPFDNRYPVWAWRPGQIIADRRDITATGIDLKQIHSVAVGLYDTATSERLMAVDSEGVQLPNNAQVIGWEGETLVR